MSDACPRCGTPAERVPAEFGGARTDRERIRELDQELRRLQETVARLRAAR